MLFHNMLTKIKSISYFLGKNFLGGDGFQKLTKQKILQKLLQTANVQHSLAV